MSDLQSFAKKAAKAEQQIAALQRQIEYISTKLDTNINDIKIERKINENSKENNAGIDIEEILLKCLNNNDTINSQTFALEFKINPNDLYGVLNALEADGYIVLTKKTEKSTVISQIGNDILNTGSPEFIVYNYVKNNGGKCSMNDLKAKIDGNIYKIGLGTAKKNKWIKIDKGSLLINNDNVSDIIKDSLKGINLNGINSLNDNKILKELKKRRLIETKTIKYFLIKKGTNFNIKRVKPIANITVDDVKEYLDEKTNEWNGPPLKEYNFNAFGQQPKIGELHPLMKMRQEMRNILLDMGFKEMETNNYVESSFWNFDSLFQPQQHPARDAHDTFFLKQPKLATIDPKNSDYLQRVKATHQTGLQDNKNSIGWRYKWEESEARKNILRTHTTAVSARTLYALANQKGGFKPSKYFSIDRVFRNETIDPTHLAEFHQVEGFVADYDLTLGHLIGVIGEFFRRIGLPKVQFKPAYNPYTEPSMEIFGWSQERQDWIEVGNSGVFRPEMLEPMGLPKNVRVIAWGLGLERPCMIATGVDDIRKLFGPKVDVKMVQEFPFVRYDTISTKIPDKKVNNNDNDIKQDE